MNEVIRAAVVAQLRKRGMTRADLARKLERTPQEITRALNDTKGGAGKVPTLWADIFDALGMELIARVEDTED